MGTIDLVNGSSNDLMQGNADLGVLATLTAAATGATLADLINSSGKGVKLVIDITALSGATLTLSIKGKDPASGKYYTILASAGLVGTGTTVLTVYPGLTAATNLTASDHLPRTWQVSYTLTGGTVTGTIGACLLV